MSEASPFTLESFYRFTGQGKLMAAKCKKCQTVMLPPKPMCTNCFSSDLEWIELEKKGKLGRFIEIMKE